ncbi:hypothetical protein O6H91_15G011500 [Diphasiastrum complanatum]|uniref:Uncharacterized protein n=2 Tax=Diphasiastrum complanatum TaxID=34168 RepID=A0ACC2BFW3_DIPCM|nr:hypothetical protein O6H91_15G010600 [Diphasiastrum complanatum]KAJ7528634.1 hypothetical protein O6H91_15G011500 [Diphasiastrum complanatum]
MGRKAGIMRVNPKKFFRNQSPCLNEMMTFLACLKKYNFEDEYCMKEKDALNACVELQARMGKPRFTLNYHLQRLAKVMRR